MAAREIVDELAPGSPTERQAPGARPISVLGCPASDPTEEVGLRMLQQVLNPAVVSLEIMPAGLLSSEIVERVERERPPLLCLASLGPGGAARTRHLLKRLRACCPDAKILVGR